MNSTVIIPTYNSQSTLCRCIHSVRNSLGDVQIIVVDGGSRDHTCQLAQQEGAVVVSSHKGRGIQFNTGANMAATDILIFLHADTYLPEDASGVLDRYFSESDVQIGTFSIRFDHNHWMLNIFRCLAKFDSLWTRFGDQCIVIRRDFFYSIGKFPRWPLFEDVSLLQEARIYTCIHSFPAEVVTSAQKFKENGVLNQLSKDIWLMCLYLKGASPFDLAKKYES